MKLNYNSGEMKLARIVAIVALTALAVNWFVTSTDIGKSAKNMITTSPGISMIELFLFLVFVVGMTLLVKAGWQLFIGPAPGIGSIGKSIKSLSYDLVVIIISIALLLMFQHGWFGSNWAILPP